MADGLFVTPGKDPLAIIGELGPETVATLTSGVPNLGPRVSLVSAKGDVLGCALGSFAVVWRDFSFSVSVDQTKKFLSAGFTEVTQQIAAATISYGYA